MSHYRTRYVLSEKLIQSLGRRRILGSGFGFIRPNAVGSNLDGVL